jgi:hypothetical protein
MKHRYFWGTPTTDTDIDAFETALRGRVYDVHNGEFAAVAAVDRALDQITRKSGALLQFNALLAVLAVLFGEKVGGPSAATLGTSFQWALALVLLSCVLVLPNFALIWSSDPGQDYANPRRAYLVSMNIHKMRAARFTTALVLTFIAVVLTLLVALPIR